MYTLSTLQKGYKWEKLNKGKKDREGIASLELSGEYKWHIAINGFFCIIHIIQIFIQYNQRKQPYVLPCKVRIWNFTNVEKILCRVSNLCMFLKHLNLPMEKKCCFKTFNM